jgi:hypothetical protein
MLKSSINLMPHRLRTAWTRVFRYFLEWALCKRPPRRSTLRNEVRNARFLPSSETWVTPSPNAAYLFSAE